MLVALICKASQRRRDLRIEDNLRVPSGVAYMLQNRTITKRVLPEIFNNLTDSPR